MGVINWLLGPGMYDKDQAKKRAAKEAKDKKLFGSYSSAADYAIEHREEYESFDEAVDAWDAHKRIHRGWFCGPQRGYGQKLLD